MVAVVRVTNDDRAFGRLHLIVPIPRWRHCLPRVRQDGSPGDGDSADRLISLVRSGGCSGRGTERRCGKCTESKAGPRARHVHE